MAIIATFGSGSVTAGSADYQDAYQLGYALGRAGYTLMTGGYKGTMEAVSRGAHAARAHVIGVTYLENGAPAGPLNPWVKEEICYKAHNDRLLHLVRESSGYVVLPGGMGTQREMMKVIELTEQQVIPPRPLVLLGSFWQQTAQEIMAGHTRPALKQQWVMVQSANEALAVIRQHVRP